MKRQGASRRIYRLLLRLLPPDFRRRFGPSMEEDFRLLLEEAASDSPLLGRMSAWRRALWDLVKASLLSRELGPAGRLPAPGEIRQVLRGLGRSPGYVLTAAGTVALAVGANAAIFTLVDHTLLRPLPFHQPERLTGLWETLPERGLERNPVAPGTFYDWRRGAEGIFKGLEAYVLPTVTLAGSEGPPRRHSAASVTPGFFDLLGTPPRWGGGFGEESEEGTAGRAVVLGEALARQLFGDPSKAVGRAMRTETIPGEGEKILIDGRLHVVVGVMPASFAFPQGAELWLALNLPPEQRENRGSHFLRVVGRLADGVSLSEARERMAALTERLLEEHPKVKRGWRTQILPLAEDLGFVARRPLLLLQGAVLLLLALAVLNLVNLQSARTARRLREFSVRSALGAGRARLGLLQISESVGLALAGGAAGLGLAYLAVRAILATAGDLLPRPHEVAVDLRVALIALAASAGVGVVLGLASALRVSRADPARCLNEGGRAGTGAKRRARWILVGAQVALALTLLAGAGVLTRSLMLAWRQDPGFDPDNLLALDIDLSSARYPEDSARVRWFDELLERVRRLPGVRSAALASTLPVNGAPGYWNSSFRRPHDEDPRSNAYQRWVSPGYFSTLGIPLLRGRDFTPQDDRGSPDVVIIDRALADRYFPGEDPIGKRLITWGTWEAEIVGVVGNVCPDLLSNQTPEPHFYVSFRQSLGRARLSMQLAARTRGEPLGLAPEVRETIARLDPNVAPGRIRTMREQIADTLSGERFRTVVLGCFAAAAYLLAVVGLFGVLSYLVAQRRREMGIRLALGATRSRVLSRVLGEGLSITLLGSAAGLALWMALSRLVKGFLFQIDPADPATLALALAALALSSLAASYLPARRAASTDPASTLREP